MAPQTCFPGLILPSGLVASVLPPDFQDIRSNYHSGLQKKSTGPLFAISWILKLPLKTGTSPHSFGATHFQVGMLRVRARGFTATTPSQATCQGSSYLNMAKRMPNGWHFKSVCPTTVHGANFRTFSAQLRLGSLGSLIVFEFA